MSSFKQESDPYKIHRLALAPFFSENPQLEINRAKDKIPETDEKSFLNFILQNGLGYFWHETLFKTDTTTLFSAEFTDKLKRTSFLTTANYIQQQQTLKKVTQIFNANAIPHAIFKGVHIREIIYDNPAGRSACDIDILVSKADKESAIKSLVKAGFTFYPSAKNISHEASLSNGNTAIDLHWEIMRPGRTRRDLTDDLLATRQGFSDHWGLSNEANLFIMLVHSVFTKYATSPNSSLMRVVDLVKWIEQREPDWNKVLFWLDRAGLRTAAWVMLEWVHKLTDINLPQPIAGKLQPGKLRTKYLRYWIDHDLATRYLNHPFIIQAFFTLPVHDTFMGGFHAVKSLIREKRNSEKNKKNLIDSVTNQ